MRQSSKNKQRHQQMHEVLYSVGQIWINHPELRLGQLLCLVSLQYNDNGDPFYLPDQELIRKVIEYDRRNKSAI